jgi:hypothetical protein
MIAGPPRDCGLARLRYRKSRFRGGSRQFIAKPYANVEFHAGTGLRCGLWHMLTKSNRLFRVEIRRPISKRCQPPGEDARLNSLSIQMAGRLPIS